MRKQNNLRLENRNSRVFKQDRERLLDFGNERHEESYTKWKVCIKALTDIDLTDKKAWWGTSPFEFSYRNSNFIKELQSSINGEFLFTLHRHYSAPYKQRDLRGILFETAEHKVLFILKHGDIMQNNL